MSIVKKSFDSPIRLPMLTFLCGPPNSGQEALADELSRRDPELVTHHFYSILLDTTEGLFGTYGAPTDPPDPWYTELERFLRSYFGPGALGTILLRRLTDMGEINSVFERNLIRDCSVLDDIQPFIDKYGARNILLIHCDTMQRGLEDCRNIWLPSSDLSEHLALLAKELN